MRACVESGHHTTVICVVYNIPGVFFYHFMAFMAVAVVFSATKPSTYIVLYLLNRPQPFFMHMAPFEK